MIILEGWSRPDVKCGELCHCVEVRQDESGMVLLRSSLSPYAVAKMTQKEFAAHIIAAKLGEYDRFVKEDVHLPITDPAIEIAKRAEIFKRFCLEGGQEIEAAVWESAAQLAREHISKGGTTASMYIDQQLLKEGYTGDL